MRDSLPPKKNWNDFGKVLKCQTPSGRASLTLYKPSHKIRHCQGTYCVHFSLFYSNVQFCTLLKLYINVHWVSSGKKYKGYRFKTSQLSTIVAGISKHSNHLGFKNPSFFCDVLWIPNVAESFSDEILHHESCNSFTEIKKAVIEHLKQVFGEPPPLR